MGVNEKKIYLLLQERINDEYNIKGDRLNIGKILSELKDKYDFFNNTELSLIDLSNKFLNDIERKKKIKGINKRPNIINKRLVKKRYDKKGTTNQRLNKLISKDGVFSVNVGFKHGSSIVDGTQLRGHYYTLIKKKTLEDDPQLMDDIIKERKSILQHRISCDVTLHVKEGVSPRLKVFGTLIEHGMEIVNFWQGKVIDPSSFAQHVGIFQGNMKAHNVKGVTTTQTPTKKTTIIGVDTNFTFA